MKANKHGASLSSTDETTLKYCLLSEDGCYFLLPTKAVLDDHNIVITTTAMAFNFHSLSLPQGFFTHIFIDEASQMLECNALIALSLAGPTTRVVLAGDHMQMGPKLFSVSEHRRSNHTLLNRLFHYYQDQHCDAAVKSRIIFSENYRSTGEIVDFVSTHLYVGKNDIIQAAGKVPAPADGRALKLHHIRGECLSDPVTLSWYNSDEVGAVVEEVRHILERWPLSWGTRDPSTICVLSEGSQVSPRGAGHFGLTQTLMLFTHRNGKTIEVCFLFSQVQLIRRALSKRHLSEVKVENIANVQGNLPIPAHPPLIQKVLGLVPCSVPVLCVGFHPWSKVVGHRNGG